MSDKYRNPNLIAAERNVKEAKKNLNATIVETINSCKHEYVGVYKDCSPPERVCLQCGLTEPGWGVGYILLTHEFIKDIGRREYLDSRTLGLTEDIKSRIHKKISTLKDELKNIS